MGLALKEIYEPDNKEDRRAPKEKPAASRRGFPKRDGDTTECRPSDRNAAENRKPSDGNPAEDRKPSDGNPAEDTRPSDRNAAENRRPSDGNAAETGTPRLRKKTARLESLERERF